MAELDKEHTKQFLALAMPKLKQENPEFTEALLQNGFVIEDEVSELDMIRYDMLRARFGNRSLAVTLTPTQDCNFGCRYCYEKGVLQSKYMDEATQDAVVDYIEENIIVGGNLQLCWYGGEPLLALDIIKRLTERFLVICEEKKVTYEADIITNGYLLTPEVVNELLGCKITKYQITLDGNEKTHNERRPLVEGTPTYQTIWENILKLKDFREKIRIVLRVNIDKNNTDALSFVKQNVEKEGMDDFIFVYPGRVIETEICHNSEECYSSREFAVLEQEFFCSDAALLYNYYPQPKHLVCFADSENSAVIDADGNIYKCFMEIGDKNRCIGNVRGNEKCREEVLYQYLLWDATEDKKCKKCKYLPICMGGCPKMRYKGREACTKLKYTLSEYMKYFPQTMKEKGI